MAGQLKVGIIGCGRIVETSHLPALIGLSEYATVVAVADSSEIRRSAARILTGLPESKVYADYRDMLASERLDVVDIALPHYLHERAAVDAASAGVNIIIEKPLAPTVAEADRMIEAAERAGVQLAVVHNYLYRPPEAEALRLIQEDTIGRPFLVRLESLGAGHYLGAAGYDPDWRTRPLVAGGGALLDNGYHYFYSARHFLGRPAESVFARVATLGQPIDVDDTALVVMSHVGGAVSSIQVSWALAGGGQRVSGIHGPNGSIAFGYEGHPISLFLESVGRWNHLDIRPGDGFTSLFRACFRSFIDGMPPPVGPAEARLNLALIRSAYQSQNEHRAVKVSPATGEAIAE